MILTHFLVDEGEIVERIEVNETEIDADLLEMGKRILPVLRKLTEEKEQQNRLARAELDTLMEVLEPNQPLSSFPQEIMDKMHDLMKKTGMDTPPPPIETGAFPVSIGLWPLTSPDQKDLTRFSLLVWGEKIIEIVSTVVPLVSDPDLEGNVRITIGVSLVRGEMTSPDPNYVELKQPLVKETTAKIMEMRPALVSFLTDSAKDLETQEKMLQFSRSLAFAMLHAQPETQSLTGE